MKYAKNYLFILFSLSLNLQIEAREPDNRGIIGSTLQELAAWSEINALLREELIYAPIKAWYKKYVPTLPGITANSPTEASIDQELTPDLLGSAEKRRGFAALAGTIPAEITEIVEFINSAEKYVRVGARMPRGILLWGPPGTGKTSIARAIAEESGAAFIARAGSEFIHTYVGVGPAAIRELFNEARDAAERSPANKAIIFIDEIDAIGGKREGELSSEYRNTLNELLNQFDGFKQNPNIFVLAATNNPNQLDAALLRRLERHVHIGLPDEPSRQAIIAHYTQQIAYSGSPELFSELAKKTSGFSGDELRTLVNEAAIRAVRKEQETVTEEHFIAALSLLQSRKTKR